MKQNKSTLLKKVTNATIESLYPTQNRTLGKREFEILEEVSGTDLLIGFLLSARSSSSMFRIARKRASERQNAKRIIERLERKGMIVSNSHGTLRITKAGQMALNRSTQKLRLSRDTKNRTWDKKWRLVIFDIPEEHKRIRDNLRSILKRAGFEQLQQSVWVHPFDCSELTVLLQEDARLEKSVVLVTAEYISNERTLRKLFGV